MRLRSLYIDQLYRLKHVLREKRRNYIHTLRTERETLCSIHDQAKDTISERKLYEKLKALNKYQRRNGVEAIMYKKFLEKRQKVSLMFAAINVMSKISCISHLQSFSSTQSRDGVVQPTPKPSFHVRCIFTEGGVKCGDRIIPSSKFCRKHILEDKKQVLFRACSIEKAGVICKEPVPAIFEDTTCTLHIQLPPQRNYAQKKYESDTDEETTSEPNLSNKIKKEEDLNDGDVVPNPAATAAAAAASTSTSQQSQPQQQQQLQQPIELKTETKVEVDELDENMIPADEADKNVTICHDTIEQAPIKDEIKTEQSDIQPMEH